MTPYPFQYRPEVGISNEAGMEVAENCSKGGHSDATNFEWRARFGGMAG